MGTYSDQYWYLFHLKLLRSKEEVHMRSYLKEQVDKIMAYLFKVERRTLLWTNSNPDASFAAQTISLDLSNYDDVEIATRLYSGIISPVTLTRGIKGLRCSLQAIRNDSFWVQARDFYVTDTGVQFYDCKLSSSGTVYTDQMIPVRIYGIKSGGGTA